MKKQNPRKTDKHYSCTLEEAWRALEKFSRELEKKEKKENIEKLQIRDLNIYLIYLIGGISYRELSLLLGFTERKTCQIIYRAQHKYFPA